MPLLLVFGVLAFAITLALFVGPVLLVVLLVRSALGRRTSRQREVEGTSVRVTQEGFTSR